MRRTRATAPLGVPQYTNGRPFQYAETCLRQMPRSLRWSSPGMRLTSALER